MRFGVRPQGLARAESDSQRQAYEPLLMAISSLYGNVNYESVFRDLCGTAFCPLFDGETLLFRDGDHLSREGALVLQARMQELLGSSLVDS